jgi:type II secretory pathway pseudopilin PulG
MRRVLDRMRSGDAQAGITLAELLVATFLLGLMMTLLMTVVVTTSRTFTEDRAAGDSVNIATVGMNEISRNVRAGTEIRRSGGATNLPVFEQAATERVVLHSYIDAESIDPRPIKVTFSINASRELVETRQPAVAGSGPYWTFVPATHPTASSKVVTRQITPGSNLFRFYPADNPATPANESDVALVVPAGGLSEADRRRIVTVEVRLSVQADLTQRADPVVLQNRIGLPNLSIDLTGAGA